MTPGYWFRALPRIYNRKNPNPVPFGGGFGFCADLLRDGLSEIEHVIRVFQRNGGIHRVVAKKEIDL